MITIKSIVESGLLKTDVYQKKRGIVLSNYIALILFAGMACLFFTRLLVFHNVDQKTILNFSVGGGLMLLTIVMNRFFLTTLSRLYLCWFPVVMVWFIGIQQMKNLPVIPASEYDSMRIFMLALSCIPYLLLDKKQWPVFVLGILPAFVSIFFTNYLYRWTGIDPVLAGIEQSDFDLIQLRTIISFLVISGCCVVFQVIIMSNDEFNRRLLNELQEKTNEIEAQNEELLQGQESLNQINLHLEHLVQERTQLLREQNAMLRKYAYTNAHHVRGPVARLLGLIQLSRMKTDLDYPWFFQKVEGETKAIDEIVKRIGNELEEV